MKTVLCLLGVIATHFACETPPVASGRRADAPRMTAAASAPAQGKQEAPAQPAKPAPKPSGERDRAPRRTRPEYLFL